jgi:hypothetical protein
MGISMLTWSSHGHIYAYLVFSVSRHILLAPCFLIGVCSDTAKVRLVLFHSYLELENAPLSEFRASLSARVGGGVDGDWGLSSSTHILPPPPVYEAHLELSLKMGAFD